LQGKKLAGGRGRKPSINRNTVITRREKEALLSQKRYREKKRPQNGLPRWGYS